MGGPCSAWPSGGIRFDWIGVGDLCIKLRLPCDPAFHREIHTTVRGRACGGSPLTSCSLSDSIPFCPALLGYGFLSFLVLYLLIYSFYAVVFCYFLFYYNPFHCIPICSVPLLLVRFSCLYPLQSVSFHYAQFTSVQLSSVHFSSVQFSSVLFNFAPLLKNHKSKQHFQEDNTTPNHHCKSKYAFLS